MTDNDLNSSHQGAITIRGDYSGAEPNGLDEQNVALARSTTAAAVATLTTTTSTSASSSIMTATPMSLDFSSVDLGAEPICDPNDIDWQDFHDTSKMNSTESTTTIVDQIDAVPLLESTDLKLTDLTRADLCATPPSLLIMSTDRS